MAELVKRKVEQHDGTNVTTKQTEKRNNSESQTQEGSTTSIAGPARSESVQTRAAVTDTEVVTEDLGVTITFSIPILSRAPVLPPGETAPAAC